MKLKKIAAITLLLGMVTVTSCSKNTENKKPEASPEPTRSTIASSDQEDLSKELDAFINKHTEFNVYDAIDLGSSETSFLHGVITYYDCDAEQDANMAFFTDSGISILNLSGAGSNVSFLKNGVMESVDDTTVLVYLDIDGQSYEYQIACTSQDGAAVLAPKITKVDHVE